MSIRVMYLEDESGFRRHTKNLLLEEGFLVEDFMGIYQAKEYFSEHFNDIDCIVADLNMSEKWLDEHELKADGGGKSGWIFLTEFVYSKRPNLPTVIYSGMDSVVKEIRKETPHNCIEFILKGDIDDGGIDGLIRAIKQVIQRGG